MTDGDAEHVASLLRQGKKIEAIKVLRETENLSLVDAKARAEQLQVELGLVNPTQRGQSGCSTSVVVLAAILSVAYLFLH
jgi:hypothetical protein